VSVGPSTDNNQHLLTALFTGMHAPRLRASPIDFLVHRVSVPAPFIPVRQERMERRPMSDVLPRNKLPANFLTCILTVQEEIKMRA
jgi:hypothetical protein